MDARGPEHGAGEAVEAQRHAPAGYRGRAGFDRHRHRYTRLDTASTTLGSARLGSAPLGSFPVGSSVRLVGVLPFGRYGTRVCPGDATTTTTLKSRRAAVVVCR